jgi:hypothetical protein
MMNGKKGIVTMIKLNHATLSSGACVDNATGNATIFNILEEIRVPKDRLPVAIPEVAFVGSFTRLSAHIGTMNFELNYIHPSGKQITIGKNQAAFQGDRLRVVLRLNGMPIEEFGRHKLRVQWSWPPTPGQDAEDCEGSFDVFVDVFPFENAPN